MPRGINDYDTAILQRRLWTPAVLRPAAWFDAADQSTITISTGVSEWRDKSGNGRHATQSTGSNQPTLTMNMRGLPGLTFSDHWLDATYSSSDVSIAYAGVQTALSASVYYPVGTGSDQGIAAGGTFVGRPQQSFGLFNGVSGIDTGANVISLDTPYVGSASMSSTARRVRVSGGVEATDGNSQSVSTLRIGKRANNEWPYVGTISEIVIASSYIGIRERNLVEGYLSHKWAIRLAADHPFANRPPLIGD
jgi:hypothetical protein